MTSDLEAWIAELQARTAALQRAVVRVAVRRELVSKEAGAITICGSS